ncbi:FmdB family zinc ribbon protein [Amnibacterium setariae]|uniref:FmdB family transcriptional regulator n=1 Tax=Amnibacterium setariae TaxID=2306585 RepID=A0A3A1U2K2_9MICO|nr:FmdB family zinc ribbon protein [Amnibacterium setariae]RIX30540.1 FmdB family transcriptional regulator [Amnibacterium setariae]
MPVYAYKCRDCGTPLEVHQDFSDAPLTECPVCGGALRKQYGSIGVTFNGSGFYRTDSRAGSGDGAKPSGDGAKSDSSSSPTAPAKSDSGSAKPAASSSSSSSSSGSSSSGSSS